MTGKDLIEFIQVYGLQDREPDEYKAADGIVIFYGKYSFDFIAETVAWDEYKIDRLGDESERRVYPISELWGGYEVIAEFHKMKLAGATYEEMAEYFAPGDWEEPGKSQLVA